ncbi:hypothetical protein A9K97_gp288 [Tokyovirus A1]|uniref:hypothetical protein n=1 Tax=Tokyovirus A1 TaxID=1826170 RepID=UPI0007A971A8|nr:hypothetical protein A9K97_gp288 [Tokyovirus A1]BAU80063.1 hypothetical protein [Tokyovirus A1]
MNSHKEFFVMERLPNEIVLHILSFCEAKDVCSFSRTTKECLSLAEDERLWKQLCEKKKFPKRKNAMAGENGSSE